MLAPLSLLITLIASLSGYTGVVTASSGPTQQYIIYPLPNISEADIFLLQNLIFARARNPQAIHTYVRPGQELPTFWLANLEERAAQEINQHPLLWEIRVNGMVIQTFGASVPENVNKTYPTAPADSSGVNVSRATGDELSVATYTTQYSPAATELRVLSQPNNPNIPLAQYPNYVYRTGGRRREAYIYHAEDGINQNHIDFQGRQIEWIYTPYAIHTGHNTPDDADMGQGHSTCTASKAAGNIYGAAREATLVVAKMHDHSEASTVEILPTIAGHIKDNNRQGKSVVLIPWGIEFNEQRVVNEVLLETVQWFLDNDVIVVCAAGNRALVTSEEIDTLPAYFYEPRRSSSLLVVGATDNNGIRWPLSQTTVNRPRYPQLHAPGIDVKCATSMDPAGYKVVTGTSFSTSLVAGVMAEYVAIGRVPRPFNSDLAFAFFHQSAGWTRPNGGEFVIWNGVTSENNPPTQPGGNVSFSNSTITSFGGTTAMLNGQFNVTTE